MAMQGTQLAMANSNNQGNKRGANKTKRPHRRTNSGLHGGKVPFVATADQKRMVMALAGLRMSWDEMRQIVRNPHTDQPIAKATFARVFRRELAEGGARLKQLISSKYYDALREGRDWAIRAGLRNRFRWTFEGPSPPDPDVIGAIESDQQLQITFVVPSRKEEPIDVTPTSHPPDAPADLSRPAIEPPRERRETKYGTYEYPRAEQPPSIFDRGSPRGWMK
jgi:hypothetical protein